MLPAESNCISPRYNLKNIELFIRNYLCFRLHRDNPFFNTQCKVSIYALEWRCNFRTTLLGLNIDRQSLSYDRILIKLFLNYYQIVYYYEHIVEKIVQNTKAALILIITTLMYALLREASSSTVLSAEGYM